MENLNSQSVLSPDPPYGSNWGHKIVALEFCLISPLLFLFTPQPLRAVGVLFSPMVSGWAGGRAGGRAAGKEFNRAVSQKP